MKVTLITGASGGIGEAIAHKLAERKQNLLLVARNAEKLMVLAELLTERFGVHAEYIPIDLAEPGSPEIIFREVSNRGLEVEMLINNAGIGSGGEFATIALPSELAMLQLNILSLVGLSHLFLQQMKERQNGIVVNVASLASFIPIPYMATYSASKVFVRHFTQALTQECKPYGVRVLLLCPGLTRTNFNQAAGLESGLAKGLNAEYGRATQTAEEVADELMRALDGERNYVVSGRMNRAAARLSALLPNAFLARAFAHSFRKKLRDKS